MSSVLLAEDEFLIRAVLVDALEDLGVACIEAPTGREALDVVQGTTPLAAIVVDIGLPDMSGEKIIEAAARYRPAVPIIRCSGADGPRAITDIKVHSFPKPYSPIELSKFIASLIAQGT